MIKTGSVAAVMLLAVSLAACTTSADKTTTGSASTEATSASGVVELSLEAASDPPQVVAPSICEETFSSLKVGDVVHGRDLNECTAATHAQLSSVHMEKTRDGANPFHLEGDVARSANGFDIDVAAQGTQMRAIGGQYWLDRGAGWQKRNSGDQEIDSLLWSLGLEEIFDSGGDEGMSQYSELAVAEVSDEGWKFEYEPPTIGGKAWFIINRGYYMSERGDGSERGNSILRLSRFNEPVIIEAPK